MVLHIWFHSLKKTMKQFKKVDVICISDSSCVSQQTQEGRVGYGFDVISCKTDSNSFVNTGEEVSIFKEIFNGVHLPGGGFEDVKDGISSGRAEFIGFRALAKFLFKEVRIQQFVEENGLLNVTFITDNTSLFAWMNNAKNTYGFGNDVSLITGKDVMGKEDIARTFRGLYMYSGAIRHENSFKFRTKYEFLLRDRHSEYGQFLDECDRIARSYSGVKSKGHK